jgi:hypothetical protein
MLFPMNLADIETSNAQCGGVYTSCYICHNINNEKPLNYDDLWHRDHSFGHICDFCHGGNMNSRFKEDAHHDIIANPLNYREKICEPCHADYKSRVDKYDLFLKEKAKKACDTKEKETKKTVPASIEK